MARVYRPLVIPAGVQVKLQPETLMVTGKLGTVAVPIRPEVRFQVEGGRVTVQGTDPAAQPYVGSARAHLLNAFTGVTRGYVKVLEVRGMGYRVQKTKEGVQLSCGYSHPIDVAAPAGISFEVNQVPNPEDTKEQMFEITVKGIQRQTVGETAADIRAIRPPDTYRGKGVRYRGERVRKKAGKRAVGTQV